MFSACCPCRCYPETQITISEMEFADNGRSLEFSPPKICIQEDGHVDEK